MRAICFYFQGANDVIFSKIVRQNFVVTKKMPNFAPLKII